MPLFDALLGRRPPIRLEERILAVFAGEPPHASDLRVSPDGTLLLYMYSDAQTGEGDPWVLDLAGGGKTALVADDHWYWSPAWSPDGRTVLCCSSRTGSGEVWACDWPARGWRLLTRHGANCAAAVWAPDGARVAFLSRRDGPYDLWVLDREGGTRPLTRGGLWVDPFGGLGPRIGVACAWSPDGNEIAYSLARREGELAWSLEVRAVPAAGGPSRLLLRRRAETREECRITRLSWSPDGTRLALKRSVGAKYHILVFSRGGRKLIRKKFIGHLSSCPWSPDGTRLVYAAEPGLAEVADFARHRTEAVRTASVESFREAGFLPDGSLYYMRDDRLYRTVALPARLAPVELAEPPAGARPAAGTAEGAEGARRARAWEAVHRLRLALGGSEPVRMDDGPDPVLSALGEAALHEDAAARAASERAPGRAAGVVAALTDPDPVRRLGAARVAAALAQAGATLPDPAAARLLALAHAGERELPATRVRALDALACLGSGAAAGGGAAGAGPPAGDLAPLLADPVLDVRRAAVRALARPGDDAAAILLAALAPAGATGSVEFPDDVPAAADACAVDPPATWDVVQPGRARGDVLLLEALRALDRIGTPAARAALLRHLDAPDPAVRYRALRSALRHGILPAERLRALAADRHPAVRTAAVAALRAGGLVDPARGPRLAILGAARARRDPAVEDLYWEVRLRGRVRHEAGPAATALTVSTACAGHAQWAEFAALPPGEERELDFVFFLALWETVPAVLVVHVTCAEGVQSATQIAVSGS